MSFSLHSKDRLYPDFSFSRRMSNIFNVPKIGVKNQGSNASWYFLLDGTEDDLYRKK
jgi:hypothetical protein